MISNYFLETLKFNPQAIDDAPFDLVLVEFYGPGEHTLEFNFRKAERNYYIEKRGEPYPAGYFSRRSSRLLPEPTSFYIHFRYRNQEYRVEYDKESNRYSAFLRGAVGFSGRKYDYDCAHLVEAMQVAITSFDAECFNNFVDHLRADTFKNPYPEYGVNVISRDRDKRVAKFEIEGGIKMVAVYRPDDDKCYKLRVAGCWKQVHKIDHSQMYTVTSKLRKVVNRIHAEASK
jgi:hypothetical protein